MLFTCLDCKEYRPFLDKAPTPVGGGGGGGGGYSDISYIRRFG